MDLADPFSGYSVLLRVIVYGLVPATAIFQFVRLKRALHYFQLEGYKRSRFVQWCADNRARALFLRRGTAKKPLVMTGRAWRLLVVSELLTVVAILVVPGVLHIWEGWPYDIPAWAVMTVLVFFGTPHLLIAADVILAPVQRFINGRFMKRAIRRLKDVDPLVIAVTGSFGKTSTKFAIAGVLGPPESVLATPGSYNTPLGICRTINEQLTDGHRFLVVEMGAYGPGEIAELCEFVRPTIGVLTAIGPAHLERFGSLDAIRRTKYEIVRDLSEDGVAVMNVDDPEVRALADSTDHVTVVRYGLDPRARPHVTARDVRVTTSGTEMTIVAPALSREVLAKTRLLGRYAIGHALAAAAVGIVAGRDLEEIGEALGRLEAVDHRLKIISSTSGVTVIDDAYNSNPDGADAALEVLAAMPGKRKVVVTPGMIELGGLQAEANRLFGESAAKSADIIIVVASTNREAILEGARGVAGGAEVIVADDLAEAQSRLTELLVAGDVVLFENDLPDQFEG
jgi:UDP-N-acetylmuramoyl-tripeptide--D-alanyl-D-alanine ligase